MVLESLLLGSALHSPAVANGCQTYRRKFPGRRALDFSRAAGTKCLPILFSPFLFNGSNFRRRGCFRFPAGVEAACRRERIGLECVLPGRWGVGTSRCRGPTISIGFKQGGFQSNPRLPFGSARRRTSKDGPAPSPGIEPWELKFQS